jgi:hypothetical protein
MTKHCAQLKQAALQIPLAGIYSNGNFGCRSLLLQKYSNTAKIPFRELNSNFIFCELFLISNKKRGRSNPILFGFV